MLSLLGLLELDAESELDFEDESDDLELDESDDFELEESESDLAGLAVVEEDLDDESFL